MRMIKYIFSSKENDSSILTPRNLSFDFDTVTDSSRVDSTSEQLTIEIQDEDSFDRDLRVGDSPHFYHYPSAHKQ